MGNHFSSLKDKTIEYVWKGKTYIVKHNDPFDLGCRDEFYRRPKIHPERLVEEKDIEAYYAGYEYQFSSSEGHFDDFE